MCYLFYKTFSKMTHLRLYNAQKYYVSPTQDGSEVSHSDSWRIGNTPTFYPSLYRFQFPYRNKKGDVQAQLLLCLLTGRWIQTRPLPFTSFSPEAMGIIYIFTVGIILLTGIRAPSSFSWPTYTRSREI
jgi:hypothetical protein